MTDPTVILTDALRTIARGSVAADVGPRPSDLTVRLGRASDLPAIGAVLTGPPHAMALATVVATDETGTPDGDLKVGYVFEPTPPPDAEPTSRPQPQGRATGGALMSASIGTNWDVASFVQPSGRG